MTEHRDVNPEPPPSLLSRAGAAGAQDHRAQARPSSGCPHAAARVVAVLGSPRGDDLGPQGAGLLWWPLDAAERANTTALAGQTAAVYLGTCSECAATVVSVRTWDVDSWRAGHGSAWSAAWSPLRRDGQHALATDPSHEARLDESAS